MSVLACKVIAGLMTMAGQDGTAAWCREPSFLERCAVRLEEMMGDPKVGVLTLHTSHRLCTDHVQTIPIDDLDPSGHPSGQLDRYIGSCSVRSTSLILF